MPDRQLWTERQFDFGFPVERHPDIIERLRATPERLQEMVSDLPPEILVRREGESWSIQENVGHLGDLEELWHGRLNDFEKGAEELRPADMSNRVTYLADHNSRDVQELIADFRRARRRLVDRVESMSTEDLERSAYHRRLDIQMRVVDLLYFVAEHDDHHLETIRRLIQSAQAPDDELGLGGLR